MKYFFDTEFIETIKRPFGILKYTNGYKKPFHTMQLISIGIVAEDGRKYYAISNEFNIADASEWVVNNVLYPIFYEFTITELYNNEPHPFGKNGNPKPIEDWKRGRSIQQDMYHLKNCLVKYGKPVSQIATEIVDFVNPRIEELIYKATTCDVWSENYYPKEFAYIKTHNTYTKNHILKHGEDRFKRNRDLIYNQPTFYAYYSHYDWVLLCSIFGTMADLPKGFPMYCRDLKQMLDETIRDPANGISFEEHLSTFKRNNAGFPEQKNEHHALSDAEWSLNLFQYLNNIKQ